jgi:hypothetical protein
MGNSNTKLKSDTKYQKPKANVSGEGTIKPSASTISKELKDHILAKAKKETQPKSQPKIAGSPKQPCSAAPKPQQPAITPIKPKQAGQLTPTKCTFASLTVNKDGRAYVAQVNAVPGQVATTSVEIVGGYNRRKKKVTCTLVGVSPCNDKHKTKVFDFTNPFESKSDASLVFMASSKYAFFFFPWKPPTNQYRISANTCDAHVSATVIVFPDIYWKLQVVTQLAKKKIDEIKITGTFREDDNNLTFNASTKKKSADFTYSNDDLKMGASLTDSGKKKGGEFNYEDKTTEISGSLYNDSASAHYKDSETYFDASIAGNKSSVAYKDDKTQFITYANETEYGTHYKDGTTEYHNSYSAQKLVKDDANKELSITPSERDRQLKGMVETKVISYLEVLQKVVGIVQFIETIVRTLTETLKSPISFEVEWPNIDLTGEWQWKEIPGSPKCGFDVVLTGKLKPLIGCHCNFDLVGMALAAIPYVGPAVRVLFNVYKKLTHNDVILNIKIGSSLSLSFNVSKTAGSEKFDISAPPAVTKFEVILTAEAKLQEDTLLFGYGGGAKGSAAINIYLYKPVVTDIDITMPAEFEFAGISFSFFKYIKQTSEMSDVMPDDEEYTLVKGKEKDLLKNWLASDRMPFTIPIMNF